MLAAEPPTVSMMLIKGVIANTGMLVVIAVPNETPSTEKDTDVPAALTLICKL